MVSRGAGAGPPEAGGGAGASVAVSLLGIDWEIAGFGAIIGAVAAGVAGLLAHQAPLQLVLPVAVGAGIGGVVGFWLARPLKRDLSELNTYAALLARGQLQAEPPTGDGGGEFKYLMRQLAVMAASLAAQVEALRRLADDRVRLAERAERLSVVEERQRLARELHDTVSQELFAIAMTVGAVRRALPQPAGAAAEQLGLVEEGARRAQATMRGLIRALRPVELGGQSLAAALSALLEDVEARQSVAVHAELADAEAAQLSPAVEDALFRIAQEAVSNAVRHGEPANLWVALSCHRRVAVLSVRDDGQGFDLDATPGHIGLRTMRERAAEIGGQLAVQSQLGQGTTVTVRVQDVGAGDQAGEKAGEEAGGGAGGRQEGNA